MHIVPSALSSGGSLALRLPVAGVGISGRSGAGISPRHPSGTQLHSADRGSRSGGPCVDRRYRAAATPPTLSDGGVVDLWSNQLALGVILHRLPVGMAIWWSLRPQFGRNAAIVMFAVIIVATRCQLQLCRARFSRLRKPAALPISSRLSPVRWSTWLPLASATATTVMSKANASPESQCTPSSGRLGLSAGHSGRDVPGVHTAASAADLAGKLKVCAADCCLRFYPALVGCSRMMTNAVSISPF